MSNIFKKVLKTEKNLLEDNTGALVKEVVGIVSINGVSAGRARKEKLWTLRFELDEWRYLGEGLKNSKLNVMKKVTDEQLKDIQNTIKAETIVKIKLSIDYKSTGYRADAIFEEFVEEVSDDIELNECLEKLKEPITYEDSYFGTLTFDRMVNWYGRTIEWNDENISLSLLIDDREDINSSLEVAKVLFENQLKWKEKVSDYAVEQLLSLKNEVWLQEGEEELTADEFKSRMKLEAITVNPNGDFEFWHNDGDLFGGHSILVSGNLNRGFDFADIPG
ncbi:DUF2262 domain-containing protein [Clostridium felsineum]|uniref:DUF2262 domain-containing protein n=1 Tax=Clostridium felsineum TaxID=36839 RepID=UPI00098CD142|nr:DUF2262 domain-containing protein [Clostridium felsineum]URZ01579.1 hypothetical protein CLAUR_015740 [Clostridium felsineum]